MASSRRGVLLLAIAAAGYWGVRRAVEWAAADEFAFEPIADLPGFRRLEGGAASAALDPLIGLGAPGETEPAPPPLTGDQLCAELFRAGGAGLPVAMFTDAFCQYCRILTPRLLELEEEGRIRITWHELPLLGEASELAARAALAAELQGAYPEMSARLLRARVEPTDAYLRDLAEGLGLDADRLVADVRSAEVEARLKSSRRVADRFGFYATPSLVVGRTAVTGALGMDRLAALVELESGEAAMC